MNEVTDAINRALVEPLEHYRLPSAILIMALKDVHAPELLVGSQQEVYRKLSHKKRVAIALLYRLSCLTVGKHVTLSTTVF